ncbi:putative secreted protein [Granulibacter bethesdensis]|uniref:Secreted protein n=3 Tax=Granulibacter bethesdensis TaxID=364410 RepID=Q0BVF0_GRABC|nr:putative secreted protein [Granulibacter bethesdensis CGDNIH1]AHJ62065.1 putative secreted protein [Granulibacter bethesdensis]AHJ67306.2 putative secreted protein [Granulibacter bethesdensis]APH63677.1 putative secreted protein [Granulibacter bethesdensis]
MHFSCLCWHRPIRNQRRKLMKARTLYGALMIAAPLLVSLSACGSDTPKAADTVSITCDSNVVLVGATRVEMAAEPKNGTIILTYPDPVDSTRTGSLTVNRSQHCTIAPTRNTNS